MAMRYCKDCQLYECCMRTPLGGCQEFDNVGPELNPPITPEDVRKHMSEQADWYWEKFRREAAKDILCAVLAGGIANGANGFDAQKEELVNVSIGMADELIKQLKEDKK